MKRAVSLLLCMIMLFTFAACDDKDTVTTGKGVITEFNVMGNDYDCIDDMPDWEGDKLDLSVWYGYGSNDPFIGKKSKDDKFRPEIERVTGVTFSEKNSFDNGGQTGDTKVAKMVATKKWPQIGLGIEASIVDNLIETDRLWNLEELIPKYMPNYMKIINSHEHIKAAYERRRQKGGMYSIAGFSSKAFKYYDPEYTPEKYSELIQPTDSRTWIWVRDDMLKEIYPHAKTQAEIKDIYVKNGKFEKEDLTDVVIHNQEEFRDLLVKLSDLNYTVNGRKVWPFYTHAGEDNWNLMTAFAPKLGGQGTSASCYVYFDGEKDELVNTLKEDWFKEQLRFYNGLIRDGLASKEALVDNRAAFDQKKQNGEYAILYGTDTPPTDEQLQSLGKNYSYRRVMIDASTDWNKFVGINTSSAVFAGYGIYIFKDGMTEAQVEHFLRFLDFFYSEAGMKFSNWGPRKAGLYEEDAEGNIRFTDEKYKAAMLNNGDTQILIDYGVTSFPPMRDFMARGGVNKYQPQLIYANYEEERNASDYKTQWNYAYFEPLPEFPSLDMSWDIWNFPLHVDGVSTFWNARKSTEDAMKRVFTATTDKEFETMYKDLIKVSEQNGYTDKTIKEMTKALKNRNGDKLFKALCDWELKD